MSMPFSSFLKFIKILYFCQIQSKDFVLWRRK